jgi:hypothetical protein
MALLVAASVSLLGTLLVIPRCILEYIMDPLLSQYFAGTLVGGG